MPQPLDLPPARVSRRGVLVAAAAALAGCGGAGEDDARRSASVTEVPEDAPPGPTAAPMRRPLAAGAHADAAAATEFNGGPRAHIDGAFGPLHAWPVMPIHTALLPDGRVMAYGTDTEGTQGSELVYAVWDPKLGTGADAFMTLPNSVGTDIFCGAQVLLPGSGQLLLVGGDARVNGKRNYGTAEVNLFDGASNTLKPAASMVYKRWYATAVSLPGGEVVALGGRIDKAFEGDATAPPTVAVYASTPELRAADGSWRVLATARDEYAYGDIGNAWFYPRAWLKPDGRVFILAHNGLMYSLDVAGSGSATRLAAKTSKGLNSLPSVMFAPGRILTLRQDREAAVVDINGELPVVALTAPTGRVRIWGQATVLADGKVWVSGGSGVANEMVDVAYETEIWNPSTGTWAVAASTDQPRLYHSTATLLPDATVLLGGGGTPGPVTQMNATLYHPPYLFERDNSGRLASRPRIQTMPGTSLGWNTSFTVKVTQRIARVTLVRAGAVTHSFDNEARFFELASSQVDKMVTITTPGNPLLAPPGTYMLFVWNPWGVPSVAQMLQLA